MPIPFLSPVVLGGLSTLVGNYFVNRQKQIAADREFRAAELKMANKVFDEVSISMDALAQSSRDVMFALVLRPDRDQWTSRDELSWETYARELAAWNRSRARNLALTKKYFGDGVGLALKGIQRALEDLERRIDSNYFNRRESVFFMAESGGSEKAVASMGKFLEISDRLLQVEIVALAETMIGKIQAQEVGALTTSNI